MTYATVSRHAASAQLKQKGHPIFVTRVLEHVRVLATSDPVIRIRNDLSAKTLVAFTAFWMPASSDTRLKRDRDIERRVYLETQYTAEGQCRVTYMAKMFDENALIKDYPPKEDQQIAKDIQCYLRMSKLPD